MGNKHYYALHEVFYLLCSSLSISPFPRSLDPSAAGGAAAPSSSAPLGPPLAPAAGGLGNLDLSQILRTLAQQGATGANAPPPVPTPAAAAGTTPSTAETSAAGTADQQGQGDASGDQSGNNNNNNDDDEDDSGGNMEQ